MINWKKRKGKERKVVFLMEILVKKNINKKKKRKRDIQTRKIGLYDIWKRKNRRLGDYVQFPFHIYMFFFALISVMWLIESRNVTFSFQFDNFNCTNGIHYRNSNAKVRLYSLFTLNSLSHNVTGNCKNPMPNTSYA